MAVVAKEQMQFELVAEDKTAAAFNQLKSHLMETQNRLTSLRSAASGGLTGVAGMFAGMAGGAGAAGAAFALVVTGIETARVAIDHFYNSMKAPAKTTEELLADQARLLGLIKRGYEEGATAADKFAASVSAVTRIQEDQNARDLQARLNQGASDVMGRMGFMNPNSIGGSEGLPGIESGTEFKVIERYKAFTAQIEEFRASVLRGQPDVHRFSEEVARLGETAPALRPLSLELISLTDALAKLDPTKLQQTRDDLMRVGDAAAQKGFTESLKALINMAPEANEAQIKAQKIQDAYVKAAEAITAIKSSDVLSQSADVLIRQVQKALKTAIGEINAEDKSPDRFSLLSTQIGQNVEELNLQAMSAGRAGAAVAELKTRHDLLRAALKAEREITPELREEIDKLAASMGRATNNVALSKLLGDVRFERDQFGRSDIDQSVASRMRAAGQEVDLSGPLADMIRFNEQFRQFKDIGSEFATGFFKEFRTELMAGVDAWDAFAKAGLNALNRLSDKLIDMAVQGLVQQALGGLAGFGSTPQVGATYGAASGGTGMFGGIPVPTFHSGGVVGIDGVPRIVHPAYFENAPRYHSGGIAGLRPGEVPAILERGEVVTPKGGAVDSGPRTIVNVIGAPAGTVTETRKQGNGVEIVDVVINAVRGEIGRGGFDGAMRGRYGAAPNQRVR